jgi:hypothetical protein
MGGYYGSNETEHSVADHPTLNTLPDGQWTITLKDIRDEIGNFRATDFNWKVSLY